MELKNIQIWTDGSYRPSIDVGGIGVVKVCNDQIIEKCSGRYEHTTNNKMEILAIITALKSITYPINKLEIHSDSKYCLGIITLNWRRSKNVELWMEFDKAYAEALKFCNEITFHYVKGHNVSMYNNLADELATTASAKREEKTA